MKLKTLIEELSTPDCDADKEKSVMDMEVEFGTLNRGKLSMLSAYELDGVIHIDIGTPADVEVRNGVL